MRAFIRADWRSHLATERVTHAAYRARAERLAAGLAHAGVRPGDRVGVVSQNNLEFIDLYGAVARLGAILVPVNWRLSADEVAYVVADAAPKIVIADAANQPLLQAAHSSLPMVEGWYGIGTNPVRSRLTPTCSVAPINGPWRRRIPTRTLGSS